MGTRYNFHIFSNIIVHGIGPSAGSKFTSLLAVRIYLISSLSSSSLSSFIFFSHFAQTWILDCILDLLTEHGFYNGERFDWICSCSYRQSSLLPPRDGDSQLSGEWMDCTYSPEHLLWCLCSIVLMYSHFRCEIISSSAKHRESCDMVVGSM